MKPQTNWSEEQVAIFAFFFDGKGNLVVEANAGTGKTTTITEAFSNAPEKSIAYLVFNKKNQVEAEGKIKDPRVKVRTLHSLGYDFIKRQWPSVKPDGGAEGERVKAVTLGKKVEPAVFSSILKLVGFLKNLTTSMPDQKQVYSIAEERDLLTQDFKTDELIVCAAIKVLEESLKKPASGFISFDDMVWLPVAANMVVPTFELAVVDEAQDMNMPQLIMATRSVKKDGRIVIIGDSRQAIYGFRGAATNGMGLMRTMLKASVLKLSTTYRCPKAVVRMAAKIVPDYKAADSAPEGEVLRASRVPMQHRTSAVPMRLAAGHQYVQVGDAILSRLNAPLMPVALSLLRNKIPARIEGRDIGSQLIGIIRSLKAKSVEELLKLIAAWDAKQCARLADAKNSEKRIEQVHDISETLCAIVEVSDSVADAEKRLVELFQDSTDLSKPSIVLSSVHKAKGLEWDRVFLLEETFKHDGPTEEQNILYVAITRAKKTLILVDSRNKEEQPKAAQSASPALPVQPVAIKEPAKGLSIPPPRKPVVEPPVKQAELIAEEQDDYDIPPGQIRRKVGYVFMHEKKEYVVVSINSCRALCKRVSAGGDDVSQKEISVSTCMDKNDLIRVSSNDATEGSPSREVVNQKTTGKNNETENSMKSKSTTTKKSATTENSSKVSSLDFIKAQAAEGKTEAKIRAAYEKEVGPITGEKNVTHGGVKMTATEYIIGREWRRVNKEAAPKAKAPAAKASAKAPAAAPVKPAAAPKDPAKAKASAPAPVAPPAPKAATPPPAAPAA